MTHDSYTTPPRLCDPLDPPLKAALASSLLASARATTAGSTGAAHTSVACVQRHPHTGAQRHPHTGAAHTSVASVQRHPHTGAQHRMHGCALHHHPHGCTTSCAKGLRNVIHARVRNIVRKRGVRATSSARCAASSARARKTRYAGGGVRNIIHAVARSHVQGRQPQGRAADCVKGAQHRQARGRLR